MRSTRLNSTLDNFRLRGQILTDATGAFEFASVVAGRYKLDGSYRPAHIHLTVSHPGHEPLTTQLYFKGDPYLAPKDACGDGCDSADPDRIVDLKKLTTGRGFGAEFRIVLAGRKARRPIYSVNSFRDELASRDWN